MTLSICVFLILRFFYNDFAVTRIMSLILHNVLSNCLVCYCHLAYYCNFVLDVALLLP